MDLRHVRASLYLCVREWLRPWVGDGDAMKLTDKQLSKLLSDHAEGKLFLYLYKDEQFCLADFGWDFKITFKYKTQWTTDRLLKAFERAGVA